ncbi:MAG: hypothetical protein WAT71_15820 [Ignavibacteria bacterium]
MIKKADTVIEFLKKIDLTEKKDLSILSNIIKMHGCSMLNEIIKI